jgi:TPR repeat protein
VALEWFQKSANQKYSYGYWNLAKMYDGGLGVHKDGRRAEDYYRKAARKGHNGAQKALKKRGLGWAEEGQVPPTSKEKKVQPSDDISLPDDLGEL